MVDYMETVHFLELMSMFDHGWLWLVYLGIVNMIYLFHITMFIDFLGHIATLI